MLILAATGSGAQPANLVANPGFVELDAGGDAVASLDGWGAFGEASALDFAGDTNRGHATLFGGRFGSSGGVFQQGIPAVPGARYELTIRIRWEENWDARTRFGLEFFAADDATRVGDATTEISGEAVGLGYRRYDASAVVNPGCNGTTDSIVLGPSNVYASAAARSDGRG